MWSYMMFSTDGRIRRRDFWLYLIGKNIVCVLILVVGFLVSSAVKLDEDHRTFVFMCFYCLVLFLYAIGNICLLVKRWHDRNRPGWMYLILLVPVIGLAWTFIECGLMDGTQGRNNYGRSPKGIVNEPTLS